MRSVLYRVAFITDRLDQAPVCARGQIRRRCILWVYYFALYKIGSISRGIFFDREALGAMGVAYTILGTREESCGSLNIHCPTVGVSALMIAELQVVDRTLTLALACQFLIPTPACSPSSGP